MASLLRSASILPPLNATEPGGAIMCSPSLISGARSAGRGRLIGGLVTSKVRKRPIVGLAVVLLAASVALVAGAVPATADASAELYVTGSSSCPSGGTGTQAQPFCTVSAAVAVVQPGQT